MSEAARDHARDLANRELTGHSGADGSSPGDRLNRYGRWENIAFGFQDPRSLVMRFLIDDGIPDRGHRKNLLNPEYRFLGFATGPHSTWQTTCVITFAAAYFENNVSTQVDPPQQIQ